MAGLGVDELGTGVVERHRQFDWEVAACASGGSPVDPDRQESALDAERLERGDLCGRSARRPNAAQLG